MRSWASGASRSEVGCQRSGIRPHPDHKSCRLTSSAQSSVIGPRTLRVALLTGGGDKPYALGLSGALTTEGISVDFVGSDDLAVSELLDNPRVNFLNLRGDQRPEARSLSKALRVLIYYGRFSLRGDSETENLPHPVEQ